MIPVPPVGLDAIVARFGDARAADFEETQVVRCDLPYPLIFTNAAGTDSMTRVIRVHRALVSVFQDVFREIVARGLRERATHYGGAYCRRPIRGSKTGRLSTHSWGIAIDVNPAENAMGTDGRIVAEVVQVFVEHGFTWGGIFKRKDPMHFQYCSGY